MEIPTLQQTIHPDPLLLPYYLFLKTDYADPFNSSFIAGDVVSTEYLSNLPTTYDMASHFKTISDFENFAAAVKRSSRHVHSVETLQFLETLYETGLSRLMSISSGKHLWRAQLGGTDYAFNDEGELVSEPRAHPASRMKPAPHILSEGRVNAKGIPCLYLATNRETAMAEVRPWINGQISIAQFKLNRDLRLVNFTIGHDSTRNIVLDNLIDTPFNAFNELTQKQIDEHVWQSVDRAFSAPVDLSQPSIEYVPTQVVAEFFKSKGFDGVVYGSQLAKGYSVALFDMSLADLVTCSVAYVRSIKFEFTDIDRTYYQRGSDAIK